MSDMPNPTTSEIDLSTINLYDLIGKDDIIIHNGEVYELTDLSDERQKTLIQVFKALLVDQKRENESNGGQV